MFTSEIAHSNVGLQQPKRNDVRKGDAAEAYVIAKLLNWGFDAHDSRRDLPYDVVVDLGPDFPGRILRIQVKGCSRDKRGTWQFHIGRGNWRSATGTYEHVATDYDVLGLVALSLEKVLFVHGVRKRFRAKTGDFISEGAELDSWKATLAAVEAKQI